MNGRGDSDEWDDSDDPTVHPSHLGGECCDAAGVTWAATFHRPGDSNVATSRHDPLGKGREGWNDRWREEGKRGGGGGGKRGGEGGTGGLGGGGGAVGGDGGGAEGGAEGWKEYVVDLDIFLSRSRSNNLRLR